MHEPLGWDAVRGEEREAVVTRRSRRIVLEKEDLENRKFLREVRMLALMKNKYIVRYNSVRV